MYKHILLTIAAVLTAMVSFAQQDISLDGEWRFSVDGTKWENVMVPHTYNTMEGLEDYDGPAVYERTLPITANMKGKTVRIHFGAVHHDAVVYVNGKKVGEHLNKGYTPFSMDITPYLNLSGENRLRVECSNAYTDQALPYKRSFDWSNDGGIYRSVRLHVSGRQTLRYVHATPSMDGTVRFDIRLFDDRQTAVKGQLSVKNRQTDETLCNQAVNLKKLKGDRHFSTAIHIDQPQTWHFDHPNLYDFTFEIPSSDAVTDHFGFREFKVEGRGFVLNGEPVRLPGIEDMPGSNPQYGMAESRSYMEQSVRTMKDLNTTITRFHWVQDDERLTLLDEMGILTQEELSWWQQPWKELTPELRQVAREAIEEMIEAHYNHPCLYGWGISNEVWGNNEEIFRLADLARSLDPTRIVDVIHNDTYKELDNNPSFELDLPTWNEYTGTWSGNRREDLPGRMAQLDSALHDRPLFITEAGLCEPAFVGGDARRVDDMIYHIKEWQQWPFVCGYIYFCLQDYRTQMGEEGLGKYRIRRHGVTRCDLTPKASYHVLRQLMAPIDITEVVPANSQKSGDALAGQVVIDASDHDARITLSVKNTIPSYTLRGYQLKFVDGNGQTQNVALPDLKPGDKHTIILKNINPQYTFEVIRPNGFSVIKY